MVQGQWLKYPGFIHLFHYLSMLCFYCMPMLNTSSQYSCHMSTFNNVIPVHIGGNKDPIDGTTFSIDDTTYSRMPPGLEGYPVCGATIVTEFW